MSHDSFKVNNSTDPYIPARPYEDRRLIEYEVGTLESNELRAPFLVGIDVDVQDHW